MAETGSQWVLVERGSHLITANLGPNVAVIQVPELGEVRPLAVSGDAVGAAGRPGS